jgi:hypothetical protein
MGMTEGEARARHPAGSQWIPKVEILQRLLGVIEDNHWMYGEITVDCPSRLERWDLRSMLDYCCFCYDPGHFRPSYTTFYWWRSQIMSMFMAIVEVENYGEWRFWETDKERTYLDMQSVVQHALRTAQMEAEKK